MVKYLLDTNHVSPALRKASPLRDRILQARRSGHRFVCCHGVIGELEIGIQQTPKPEENRRQLNLLFKHVRLWQLDLATTRHYGSIYLELQRIGRVLSQVDITLASLARQHNLTLLTSDRDFEALPDLKTENWMR
jgi:tRNA(fMet)-specific endonuclease VapC